MLRVAHWPAPKAASVDSKHPPILYFAGIGTRIEELFPLANILADREIISFDMPGIGGSAQPVLPYSISAIAAVAAQLLDDFDIASADIIGLSWGGVNSLAVVYPDLERPTEDFGGRIVRLNIGLETPEDLINDLSQAMQAVV